MTTGRSPAPLGNSSANALNAVERQLLLDVARRALCEFLDSAATDQHWIERVASGRPALQRPSATFVTLRVRESGELRGCRGELDAVRPLAASVAAMSIAAGTCDPRFATVTLDEMPALGIEINVLGSMSPIRPEQIELGRHGLLITMADNRGLLLPDCPHLYGWDLDAFLTALCRKAGLPDDAWRSPGVELSGFESERWGDPD